MQKKWTKLYAEIPNKNENPKLYELITQHIIDVPCGDHNLRCIFIAEDKNEKRFCSKKFPKEFRETTILGNSSYGEYKKDNDGKN